LSYSRSWWFFSSPPAGNYGPRAGDSHQRAQFDESVAVSTRDMDCDHCIGIFCDRRAALIAYGDLDAGDVRLPVLQDGLVALMGVSHAAYLGSKSVDQTQTTTQ
jgi:hypothetical protein